MRLDANSIQKGFAIPPHTYPQIVLASGSQARQRLLSDAGIRFTVDPADIDESAAAAPFQDDPDRMAAALAKAKATHVWRRNPRAAVLGADQVLAVDSRILSKPRSPAEAREHLRLLSGRSHRLISAATVVQDGRTAWHGADSAVLTMHDLDAAEIDRYVDAYWDKIRHCVGCYRIEAEGARLFSGVDGDHFTIQGFPLIAFLNHLRKMQSLE
ncbi:Maf family protein [Paracoccus pacificus]|uniref:Nucleoside triphosphate pyrophosphatase n=1 Tax=Paracoccus pacificus TaxID=1463598 RepID=A0ABW4R2U7_9RHOB